MHVTPQQSIKLTRERRRIDAVQERYQPSPPLVVDSKWQPRPSSTTAPSLLCLRAERTCLPPSTQHFAAATGTTPATRKRRPLVVRAEQDQGVAAEVSSSAPGMLQQRNTQHRQQQRAFNKLRPSRTQHCMCTSMDSYSVLNLCGEFRGVESRGEGGSAIASAHRATSSCDLSIRSEPLSPPFQPREPDPEQ